MQSTLRSLFNFLKDNREYNHNLQVNYHLSSVLPYSTKEDKVLSLLYDIVNTQSQPKINYISEFFKNISENKKSLQSFQNFVQYINPTASEVNFNVLFQGLKNQPGWGNKTSALFVKNIFQFHNGNYSEKLFIWDDVPENIEENDTFYLPVDAVIIAIFNKIDSSKNWNFKNINFEIKKNYNGNEIEIWDDLWFWGFITQNGSGNNRIFEWNENKYWTLKEASKEKSEIHTIKEKSADFLNILKTHNKNVERNNLP